MHAATATANSSSKKKAARFFAVITRACLFHLFKVKSTVLRGLEKKPHTTNSVCSCKMRDFQQNPGDIILNNSMNRT